MNSSRVSAPSLSLSIACTWRHGRKFQGLFQENNKFLGLFDNQVHHKQLFIFYLLSKQVITFSFHLKQFLSSLFGACDRLRVPILVVTDHTWDLLFSSFSFFDHSICFDMTRYFKTTWFNSLNAIESLNDGGHLLDIDHPVVVHVVQPERPLQLVFVWRTKNQI